MSSTKTTSSIEKWLPSLKSKQIIPSIMSQITDFDINDDKSKIGVLDAIISKLTQKLLSLNDSTQPKNYALSKHTKHLLLDGYINKYWYFDSQRHFPNDLILLIYKYYDYSLIWIIKDTKMSEFRAAKYRDIMYGPKLELRGVLFQITLCPMGWKTHGYMTCYIELEMEKNIKCICINAVIYIKEFNLWYKAAAHFDRADGWGIHSKLFPYHKVKNVESLTFEYNIDIMYIEYKQKSNMKLEPLILCTVPEIEDTEFIWNVDDDLLEEIKNIKGVWFYYSDNFMDNCLTNYLSISDSSFWIGLTLLRMPFNIEKYIVSITFTVFYDNRSIIIKREAVESLTVDSKNKEAFFKIDKMDEVKVLSFKTQIKVHEAKRKQK